MIVRCPGCKRWLPAEPGTDKDDDRQPVAHVPLTCSVGSSPRSGFAHADPAETMLDDNRWDLE